MGLLVLSCAVPIKNQRWFGDVGPGGAVWFETLTSAHGQIDKPTWDQMRIGMACTTTDTLAEIKSEIEKLCSSAPCDYEKVQSVLGKFQQNLDSIKEVTQ